MLFGYHRLDGFPLDVWMKRAMATLFPGVSPSDFGCYAGIAQQYILQQKQAELQKVAPTDEEIRTFYESNKASFVWNDMIKFFMITVHRMSWS